MWQKSKKLGAGEFGKVYLAENRSRFRPSIKIADAAVKTAAGGRESFFLKREAQFLKEFIGNPYIVQFYGEGGHGNSMFMEYANGGTLAGLIESHGDFMPETEVVVYTFMLLKGLSSVHEKGIVHGDIKPENVLVFTDDEGYNYLKLADFGLSQKIGNTLNKFQGTKYYAPPESLRYRIQGKPADIFSLGCTVLKTMNGNKDIWKEPDSFDPEIPDYVSDHGEDFLRRCFEASPFERWTADQLLDHPFIQEEIRRWIPKLELMQTNLMKKTLLVRGLLQEEFFEQKLPHSLIRDVHLLRTSG